MDCEGGEAAIVAALGVCEAAFKPVAPESVALEPEFLVGFGDIRHGMGTYGNSHLLPSSHSGCVSRIQALAPAQQRR